MFSNRFLRVEFSRNLASHLRVSWKYCSPRQLLLSAFLLINSRLHTPPISRVRSGAIIYCGQSWTRLEIHRPLRVTADLGLAAKQSFSRWFVSRGLVRPSPWSVFHHRLELLFFSQNFPSACHTPATPSRLCVSFCVFLTAHPRCGWVPLLYPFIRWMGNQSIFG